MNYYIGAKIYYDIKTGDVLTITSEMQGNVEETTKEQDMEIYQELTGRNINDVDFIELQYGTLASIFTNAKSYKVNLETKKLEIEYLTQEEIDKRNTEYAKQAKNEQALNDSISNISEYLNQNSNNISDIENYILQKEQNKILGVM
ncbi:hypothetical protein [Clostridium saccharobutylicum]|uniref:Uncharacterized protein n=1 Tax=Clostridium saccharobutylicum DSM 13864 TaxID=1345695 RepID=U5MRW6_CLOSA|nr:hypothetical protein [Clostridium saccharobutylicum]AGX43268.1 hypothetical protein CLSA_c22930 [Clostridium saccharobutylicum DSM 13864]AQR90568.1 hypothetical protein CLOSC_22890 [Clostridium saccharobutylicum]AQS00472.1 hypothetical protein CSACC_22960 [Clostridium saccharobutylicum]AQS10122.1 hypothetical protein CLOBY_22650 [Clostridium saccharobutylicum]AQS14455.1 hypothetical protein CLOSACC_22960 [Clostridium saccharobutylicum]